MKKTQGFGIVGAVIVIAAVAVVTLIAWRLSTGNSTTPSASTNGNTPQTKNEPTPQPTPEKYLDLKELGVKIKLDDKTAELTYLHDTPSDSRADGAWIIDRTMKALDNANAYCAGATSGKIGRIDKSKDQHYWGETPLNVDNKTSFKIGEFYYVFRPLQAECSQDDGIAQQRAAKTDNFKTALNSIQAN